jgi:hypothetical protein
MIPICDLYRGRKPPIINHFYQYATSAEVVQYRLDSYCERLALSRKTFINLLRMVKDEFPTFAPLIS